MRLTVANILSIIMVPLANLMSVIFLGHFSEVSSLAGVALAGNILNVIYFTLSFLRMGTTGVTAQAVGRNDHESMILVGLRNGLIAIFLGAAIISLQHPIREIAFSLRSANPEIEAAAIDYFNAQVWCAPGILLNFVLMGWLLGREQNGKVILMSVVGSIANIILDYVFIVQWGWDSRGAGISYALSQYCTFFIGLVFFILEFQWQELKEIAENFWDISAFKSSFTLNSNIFISNMIILVSNATFHAQSSMIGTIVYAENALLWQIFNFSLYLVEGIGFTTEALGGNFKGQGNTLKLASLLKLSLTSSVLVGITISGACVLFPQTIFGLLTSYKEVTAGISTYTPWLFLTVGFGSLAFCFQGYFLGLAEGHTLRNTSLTAMTIGFLPTMFIASKLHNNHLMWLSVALLLMIQTLLFTIQIPRTFKENQQPEQNQELNSPELSVQ
jgi:MATE family multidrug resistance protein